jgi:hypothetical protein
LSMDFMDANIRAKQTSDKETEFVEVSPLA